MKNPHSAGEEPTPLKTSLCNRLGFFFFFFFRSCNNQRRWKRAVARGQNGDEGWFGLLIRRVLPQSLFEFSFGLETWGGCPAGSPSPCAPPGRLLGCFCFFCFLSGIFFYYIYCLFSIKRYLPPSPGDGQNALPTDLFFLFSFKGNAPYSCIVHFF